ncbi:hypothetical protein COLO4_17576 [Corchorus olitorius]|uniref:Uncharacterized protein n=1 Tax=Corchorus olitorius TaxID=93759 RepID=A0A1R3JCG3_9ROSI|nr:hypothetical protein COLO4_17576 [Corchorus olitorius]
MDKFENQQAEESRMSSKRRKSGENSDLIAGFINNNFIAVTFINPTHGWNPGNQMKNHISS